MIDLYAITPSIRNREVHYCTNCSMTKPKAGGEYRVSGNKLTKRWLCAGCLNRAKERKA